MTRKIILSLLLGGLLSAATLYLTFRNVPLPELAAYMGSISYVWLIPSTALAVLTYLLRTLRWRLILQDALAIGFWQAFHPLMIGFMMNCILPGRVGELARPAILKKERAVAFGTGLATVAAERVFDMVVLIGLFATVFSTVSSRPDLDVAVGGLHLNSRTLQTSAWTMIRISVVLLLGLSALAFSAPRRWMIGLIEASVGMTIIAGPRLHAAVRCIGNALIGWLGSFAKGLSLVGHPRRALACLALTIAIWTMGVLSYFVFSLGCPGIDLTFWEMTTTMVIVCFFIALPSVPGYWGVWEAGGVFALALFGVNQRDAAGFTLVNHAVQLFPVILIGLVSALVTSVNILYLSYRSKPGTQDLKLKGVM
jgi:uncharacterized protein (TIRG00374 family)